MKNKKIEILVISIIIILQTLIYIFVGVKKSYIHMDEAYSMGLASYDKVEIQDNSDFYNTWHNKEYYEDYMSVQENEKGKFSQVYENQKNDVHPPLYYLLLRLAMGFSNNGYSKWPGIIVNIIIFVFITLLAYYILQELLCNEKYVKEKAVLLAFISSITMASLTNVIYIRMYALSTFNILLTTFLHIRLLKCGKQDTKLLILIGISALIGSLTHYYYLFYLAMMYMLFAIKYIKNKQWKKLGFYTLAMLIAAIISLIIFPYSINHMFFGYRGQGVIDKFKNISMFFDNIKEYLKKVNRFCFNNIGIYILIINIIAFLYIKFIKRKIIESETCNIKSEEKSVIELKRMEEFENNRKERIRIIVIPTFFYFLLVAVASPWIELRYIMPICSLLFIILIYWTYALFSKIFNEKIKNIIIGIILLILLISPAIFKIEPEVMFSDKTEIVEKLSNEYNLPTLYVFYSENNRFLDDILLFSKINESFIAKDLEYSVENIKSIFDEKDISRGIIIFINQDEGNDEVLRNISDSLDLGKPEHLKRMNACNIYFIPSRNF